MQTNGDADLRRPVVGNRKLRNRMLKLHPATLVLASFVLVIAVGAFLLELPAATRTGRIAWIDAVFTATSAVCVTGLTVVDTGGTFTLFGQIVILALIQIGGLGLMTISVALFRFLGRAVSFRHRMAMQDLFSHTPREDILSLVKSILIFTLAVEAIGAILLTVHWNRDMGWAKASYTALFHSVSAFCNAGFSLFSDNLMTYKGDLLVNGVICSLIVVGGIGFPVLYELQSFLARRVRQRVRLSVHTKSVLLTTPILIFGGALMIAHLEKVQGGPPLPLSEQLLVPLFQSITCRTAGFNTVDIGALSDATLVFLIFLMFFGASPGSCGGGVKTTTLALLTAFTICRVRRRRRVNLFKKSIPLETVTRSISLVLISVTIISLFVFLLLAGDSVVGRSQICPRGPLLTYLFETVSAFGTVGLSMNLTQSLSLWGKSLIMLMMLVGRIGVLTFSYIIVGAGTQNGIEHAEESMMIG